MVSMKILFLAVTAATVGIVLGQVRMSSAVNGYIAIILSVTGACVGSTSIVFLERRRLGFHVYVKNQTVETSQIPGLLGIRNLKIKEDHVCVQDENGRLVVHAYIRIRDIPFLIDDLDQNRRSLLIGNFVRLLGTLGFIFEIIPRIIPISSEAFLKSVGKQIEDQKLVATGEGALVNPARQARIQRLQRIYDRMAKGERAKDIGFLAHVMVDGNNENQLLSELETNAKTLISALESTLGIKAERLRGYDMYRTVTEFFRASSIVIPSKTFRVLTFDIAYLIPLTRPKLPPVEKILNGVYVGRTYGGMPVCLDLNSYSNPHGCTVGASGAGKSTFIKTFLTRCHDLEQIPVMIVDYAGEYKDWVMSRNGTVVDFSKDTINPFELGFATLADRIRQVVDSFDHNCDFKTINQRNAFTFYVTSAYKEKGFKPTDRETWKGEPPTIQDIIRLMEQDLDHLKPMKQVTVLSLVDRLQAVASGSFGIFGKSTVSINALTQGFTCIDLSKVTSSSLKDMIAWTVLQYIDSAMRVNGTQSRVRLIIAIDEAWKLCRSEAGLPVAIVKEGRKFGYALLVSSQDATADLAESILANAGTTVIFRTQHPKYLNFFKSAYGLNEQELSRVRNLSVGEALVKLSDDPRPFFVKVEMEEIEPEQTIPAQKTIPADNPSQVLPSSAPSEQVLIPLRSDIDELGEVERSMLETVAGGRILTISEVYSRLGISDYQANRSKNSLVEKGLVTPSRLPRFSGKGRSPETLVLTDKGVHVARSFGKVVDDGRSRGGLQHRYIVQWLVEQFEKEGWKVSVEYDVGGGKRADILVNGIAVEVELGKSEIVENVKKNRDEGPHVLVVSPHEAISSVTSKLTAAAIEVPVVTPDQAVSQLKSIMPSAGRVK